MISPGHPPRFDRSTWSGPPPAAPFFGPPEVPPKPITLPRARLFSHNGIVIDSSNRIRCDLSPDFRPPPSGHRVLDYPALPSVRPVNASVFTLATPAAWKNYFHWLLDALPRLRHLERIDCELVYTPLYQPFHHEALHLAGLAPDRLLTAEPESHYACREVTALPLCEVGTLVPDERDFLRRLILDEAPAPSRRIYISRRDAWRRRIRNEDELLRLLAPKGFELVVMQGLSMREQAALFAQAKAVVAPHGAALANLVFAPPGCRVLELFQSNYLQTYFATLSETCGLSYESHTSFTPENDPDTDTDLVTLGPVLHEIFG